MHASFFLLTVIFAICPKWHLIHLNYQRIYNRYKIRQWLFWFCSKNRERDSTKTWTRALLVVIFCNIWPKCLLVNNIALPHLRKHSRSTTIKWGLESRASCEILFFRLQKCLLDLHGKSLPVAEWQPFNMLRRNSISGHIKYIGICTLLRKNQHDVWSWINRAQRDQWSLKHSAPSHLFALSRESFMQ